MVLCCHLPVRVVLAPANIHWHMQRASGNRVGVLEQLKLILDDSLSRVHGM